MSVSILQIQGHGVINLGWGNDVFLQILIVSFIFQARLWVQTCRTLNCINRKELSHVHIQHRAMTVAMTFDKGLSESEVVYWSKWGFLLMWIMFMFWLCNFTPCFLWCYVCKLERTKIFLVPWISTYDLQMYTFPGSILIWIVDWPWQLNGHAISHDVAYLYSWDKPQLMQQPGR